MTTPQLCVQPRELRFGAGQESILVGALEDLVRVTRIDEPQVPADLQLDAEGRLPEGYRFTAGALRQVCNLIGPGLYPLLADLTGPAEDGSFALARRTFNRLVEVRFGRLVGQQRLLRHTRDRLVEGLLGPHYQWFDNAAVREQAADAAAAQAAAPRFHEAALIGRRLWLRYIAADPLVRLPWADRPAGAGPTDDYRTGLHVANSEVGGELAFRAATLVHRAVDGGTALCPYLGRGRQIHAGRDLGRKLAMVFAAAAAVEPDPARLLARLQKLQDTPLGFGLDREEDRAARVSTIVAQLAERDVPRRVGQRAVLAALYCGPTGYGAALPRLLGREALAGRSMFDLYGALTNQACTLYATMRELVERAAYQLLVGRIKIR